MSSGASRAVSMRIGVWFLAARRRRATSRPLTRGIMTSRTMASKLLTDNAARASSPSRARVTVWFCSWRPWVRRSPMDDSSSAMRIHMVGG